MAKTSALTGSQKKTQKKGLRVQRDILGGKYGGLSISDLLKQFQQAGKGAEELYAPIKANALEEFGQSTLPGVLSQFGDAGLGRSSALNQALAAARTNLSRQLASDFAGFQTNLASGILNQKYGNVGQLGQLSTQGAFQNPYQQKQQSQGSGAGNAISGLLEGGGKAYAAWQLAKLAAAPATGGASLAVPV